MGPRKPPESILKCSGLVLDFGCGHYKLQSERAKVIGLDYVPAHGADVLADFEFSLTLPFRSDVFDGAYLSHVLEHMREPVALLSEIWRVCKNNALVVVRVPHFSNPRAYEIFHRSYFSYYSLDPLAVQGGRSAEARRLFHILKRGFVMLSPMRPLEVWQLVGRVIANKVPFLYESMLYTLWPAYEIIFELCVVKSRLLRSSE